MDTRKTTCLYHTDQIITNFCKDKNCLMPLCPSCIGDHSLYHQSNSSKPQYTSIYEIIAEVQNLLYNSIYALELDKKRTVELNKKISAVNDLVHEKVSQAKNIVTRIVDDAFKDLENQLKNSLTKLHDEIGLYCQKKTQKFQGDLNQVLSELYEMNEGLSSEKHLGYIIIYLKQKEKEINGFHSKINGYLDSNESYHPKLDISSEATTSIGNSIARIIKIEGKKDIDRRKEAINETKVSIFKNKPNNKDYSQKNQKIQRSYTPKKSSIYTKSTAELNKSKIPMTVNNSIYIPAAPNPHYIPSLSKNSPINDRIQSLQKRYQPTQSQHTFPTQSYGQTNRIRDFKQQYDVLSRKISQMRKENQLTIKNYK